VIIELEAPYIMMGDDSNVAIETRKVRRIKTSIIQALEPLQLIHRSKVSLINQT